MTIVQSIYLRYLRGRYRRCRSIESVHNRNMHVHMYTLTRAPHHYLSFIYIFNKLLLPSVLLLLPCSLCILLFYYYIITGIPNTHNQTSLGSRCIDVSICSMLFVMLPHQQRPPLLPHPPQWEAWTARECSMLTF